MTQPGTSGVGTCIIDKSSSTLLWNIPKVGKTINSTGLLEFSFNSDDTSCLYPIKIGFTGQKFVDMDVSFMNSIDFRLLMFY